MLVFASFCLVFFVFSSASDISAQDKKKMKQAMKIAADGDAVFQQKNYQGAIDKYAEAIALYPTLPKAHFWKGYALYYLKEYDQAVLDLDAALAQGYKPLDVYQIRWFVNYQRKNYDLALVDAQNGLKLDPNNQTFNSAVGELLFAKGSYSEALDLFQKSILLNPDQPDLYYYVAASNAGLGNTDKILPAANEAVKRNTKFLGESFFMIAEAMRKDKNYSEAAAAYQRTISAKPETNAAYHYLSDIYRTQNKIKEAIDVTNKGLAAFPNDGNLYVDLSRYSSLAGRKGDAINAGVQAVKLLPEQSAGYTKLCRAYYETKQFSLGQKACETALKMNPNDGETNVYAGFTQLAQGREKEATEYFKKSVDGMLEFIKANPDFFDGYYSLGNAYYYVGQPDKSIEAYLKTLELNPNFTRARFNLGLTYYVNKNLPAARQQYDILIKTDKDLADKLKAVLDRK